MATVIKIDYPSSYSPLGYGTLSQWYAGQSFTIESGFDTHLDSIELLLGAPNNLTTSGTVTVEVFKWKNGWFDGPAFVGATKSLSKTGWEKETFYFDNDLSAGEYFFSVSGDQTTNVNIGHVVQSSFPAAGYADGDMYTRSATGGWSKYSQAPRQYHDLDFAINLSTVTGSAVPEPATMLLFGMGLLGLAGAGRKK